MDFVDCVMVPDGEAGSGMTFLYTDAHDNIIYIYIYCIIIHGYTLLTCVYHYNTIVHGLINQHFGHAGGPHLKGINQKAEIS